jgi:glycosyltransferase involved in cell wall biosynthesis
VFYIFDSPARRLNPAMRLVVIIATANRKSLLLRALTHLDAQTKPPAEVVVSAPDESHVGRYQAIRYAIRYVFGAQGLAAQRNRALEAIEACDTVVFFDDDFIPADDYLEEVEASLDNHPDWGVVTGRVLFDGIKGPGLSFGEGLKLLTTCDRRFDIAGSPLLRHGAYGCNMAMRFSDIGEIRFDERLPLYGWQEDTDFSRRIAGGRWIVQDDRLRGVHLGIKSGRVSGVRFGYSQIANPIYLVRKGTLPPYWAMRLIVRNLAANVIGSLWPEPHIDRLGRLKGNAIAAFHLLRGRVEPEHILKL